MYSKRDPGFLKLSRRSVLLPVALMLLIVAILSWLLQQTNEDFLSIRKGLTAIAQAESVLTLMLDYEESWRDYKSTRDGVFLHEFNKYKSRVPRAIKRLKTLTISNPATAAREAQIEKDAQDWMRFQTSAPPAGLNVVPGQWLLILNTKLNAVRGDVASLIAEERDELSGQVDHQRTMALVLFVALGGGAFLAALGLSFQSWNSIRTLSNKYEEALTQVIEKSTELQRANEDLDRRVEERTKELNAANQELELFCYSAAHDLRSPLRWIVGANQIFVEDYGNLVPEEGLSELRKVNAAATRLSKLIDCLLELARLGKVALNVSDVDLSELCSQAILEIRSREWPGPVEVTVQPDIKVKGDPLLLSLLVQNLIENGFKFSSTSGNGQIEINSIVDESEVVVTVHDNGVGFDEAFGHKLFKPFERLHSNAEFSGTGMGLANAKRIVDRHGGRIWAESKPGEGATFRFALPTSNPVS